METLQTMHAFRYSHGVGPSLQPQSFLEWTHTSFEQSLVELYNILLEKHQVGLERCWRWESVPHSSLQN
jgi:hypothetical protein